MADLVSIREAVRKAKVEGLPVSEYAVRQWVKMGAIPSRKAGSKVLLFYPNLVHYLTCSNFCDAIPSATVSNVGKSQVGI